MYDFVENNLPRSFGDVFRYNRDVQNIGRTCQSDMIHVYRCHTKFSSILPLYTLPIIWNKWAISAPGGFSRRRFGRHVKSTICISYPTQVRPKKVTHGSRRRAHHFSRPPPTLFFILKTKFKNNFKKKIQKKILNKISKKKVFIYIKNPVGVYLVVEFLVL